MPGSDVAFEAGKVVGLGMLLLKGADLILKKVENYRALQHSEVDETFKTGAAMRSELRAEVERRSKEAEVLRAQADALRLRLDAAEKRIDDLEDELHEVRAENEDLRRENERIETELRAHGMAK